VFFAVEAKEVGRTRSRQRKFFDGFGKWKKIFAFSASKYTFEKKNVSSVKRGDVMFAKIISKLRRHVKKNVAT
jgi:hypothetical protein